MNTSENNAPPTKDASPKRKPHALFDNMGMASMLGLHIVSGIIVGGVMGYGLDSWLNTGPWCFIVFLLLGIVAGFRNMWQDAQRIIKNTTESSPTPPTPTSTAADDGISTHKKTPTDIV